MVKKFFTLRNIICILAFIIALFACSMASFHQAVTKAMGGNEFAISNSIFFFGDKELNIKGTLMPLIGYILIPIGAIINISNLFIKKDKVNIVIAFISFAILLTSSILILQSKNRFININKFVDEKYVSSVTHLTKYSVIGAVLSIASGVCAISYIFINDRKTSNDN